jgi:hypothetical protein
MQEENTKQHCINIDQLHFVLDIQSKTFCYDHKYMYL